MIICTIFYVVPFGKIASSANNVIERNLCMFRCPSR
uniref:Uncharacterized protein n=1 Tax=Rhizophora mucronata TaxID=61149 RepID=A0A2P2NNS5_RHIMU